MKSKLSIAVGIVSKLTVQNSVVQANLINNIMDALKDHEANIRKDQETRTKRMISEPIRKLNTVSMGTMRYVRRYAIDQIIVNANTISEEQ